ncbi:MAG TPA: recombinase family protein [Thermoplasmata archaeon]|nr:recombinase family protein [Thermoplasmata archaeon]
MALYTRVSTEDQAKEGFSLKAQAQRLRDYVRAHEWEVAAEYVDDGHSGRSAKRPAYQRMMAERERWDRILVNKMDRIHRNSKNFLQMMEDLNRWGKRFTSMQEAFDTGTAMGRFVMDIIQRIAQLESEQIGERVYMGMSQKAKEGRGLLGFRAPYGYRFRDHALEIVPEEAKVVRKIFDRYLAAATTQKIADELDGAGVRTRQGARWTRKAIAYLLKNPAYAGLLGWDRGQDLKVYADPHPSVVTLEEFNRAQLQLQRRQPNPEFRKEVARLETKAGEVVALVRPQEASA